MRVAHVVKKGGADPVDAVRVALRATLFEGLTVPDWRRDAACREMSPDLFYDEPGETSRYEEARSVCAGCPVRKACLADALSWERPGTRHGVIGGLTARERARLVRAPKVPSTTSGPKPLVRCEICQRSIGSGGQRLCSDHKRQRPLFALSLVGGRRRLGGGQ